MILQNECHNLSKNRVSHHIIIFFLRRMKGRTRAEDFTWRRYRQRLGELVRGFVGEKSDASIGRLANGGWLGKSLSLR